MTQTRRKLLENFDEEVREKLRLQDASSKAVLDRFEQLLMRLTRYELKDRAEFLTESSFRLSACPFDGEIPLGLYELPRRSGDAHTYRLNHPLAEAIIAHAKSRELSSAEIRFNYDAYDGRISVLKPLRGKSGYLSLSQLTIESLDQAEDHLIFSAITDSGEPLEEEIARRLFSLPAEVGQSLLAAHPSELESITRDAKLKFNGRFPLVTPGFSKPKRTSSTAGPTISRSDWSGRSKKSTVKLEKLVGRQRRP